MTISCTLCGAAVPGPSHTAHRRVLYDCQVCGLVFVDPETLPPADLERARYETHDNRPDDPGYRAFLDRLALPLQERLPPGAEGLDFGSGPGPTLSIMMEERGFSMETWDPFFSPDPAPLLRRWDFVTATEVVEHFHRPENSFRLMTRLVRPGGWLAVMTTVLTEEVDLPTWWYARDPTHVSFYRPGTLAWIGEKLGWEAEYPGPNVVLYQRPESPGAVIP